MSLRYSAATYFIIVPRALPSGTRMPVRLSHQDIDDFSSIDLQNNIRPNVFSLLETKKNFC